nr:hypothetical protein [Tanacetum cinerariifolium]
MVTTIEQQVALDEALVPSTQRLRTGRSKFRLPLDIQSKESTLQVIYDVLRRCPFFKAFIVTANVPKIYMQEFWATAYVHQHSIRFKMDNKKHIVNLEIFRDMLHICPRILGQSFDELPFKEEILDFLRFFGHSAQIRTLTDVNINKLFQPWRSFGVVINKCLTRKSFGFDSFRLSQAQILWGLYHSRNIDYGFLIWEDFVYQVEHKNHKKSNEMDDIIFSTIKVVSRHQSTQQYGVMLPIELTNEEIRNTKAYKEYYAYATGEAAPKPKASARRKRSGSDSSTTPPTAIASPRPTIAATPKLTAATKGKQPAKATKAKSLFALSKVAMTEAEQLKLLLKRSMQQMHISQPSGSATDEGTDADAQEKDIDDDEGDEKDESDDEEEDDDDDKDGDERDDDGDDDDEEKIAKIDEHDDTERGRDDEEESKSNDESDDEETREEESFDPITRTPEDSEDNDELYRDVDINQGRGLQLSQDIKDSHVTLTPVKPNGQQESSSVSSQFETSMLNPTSDAGVESIFAISSSSVAPLPTPTPTMTPSIIATITTASQAPIPPTPISSEVLQNLPTFDSVFCFDDRLKSLEASFSEYKQTNPFAKAVSNILADVLEMELKKILIEKMEGNKSIQRSDEQRNLYKALVEAYEADKIILNTYKETITLKRRRDDEPNKDKEPSVGSDQGSKRQREGKEPKSASASLQTATRSAVRSTTGSKSQQASANTSLDFSNFIMNRLRVDTLTPELLAGPTYELMKGSCKRLIELEYHLEEVYKAMTDQLDWINPKGQQYLHNLLQPLSLIPDNQGRHVIPFAHFINNDLEYLRGGTSSQKYTTSMTKSKAADYGHIKWIEDLVPRIMWIQEPINYDKHALWGVSHWGRKRQQFYGFAVNRESALDVYSKRRIIAVTDLKIMEWHSYKHLDWIQVRHDDDKLYTFKEGDFKRMFTRSIVIQRRVEDLQLGVESYQKRLSDLKRKEAYTAYSNPRGFIYQNKDKKNRLMRIDE